MRCPRCNTHVKYGKMQCRRCGLHFRYPDDAQSPCNRHTAALFARVGGILGLHNFYLGSIVIGLLRLAVFGAFIGLFLCPQIVCIIKTGMFRVSADFIGIAGPLMLVAVIVSHITAIIDSVRIGDGFISRDARGLLIR